MINRRKRIGLFGGSFDPPHIGHLALAQDAYEALDLDCVWFIPTYLSPLKDNYKVSPVQRAEMLELMLRDDSRFDCNRIEVNSGCSQYSVDTVRTLKAENPEVDFFWLIGSDQLKSLHQWKSIDAFSKMVQFVVFKRPGYSMEIDPSLLHLRIEQVDIHEVLISSSEIRNRLESELPVYMFLHHIVNEHIEQNKFYSK